MPVLRIIVFVSVLLLNLIYLMFSSLWVESGSENKLDETSLHTKIIPVSKIKIYLRQKKIKIRLSGA